MIPEVALLAAELVRIPSVNPSGEPGTTETGEGRIAAFLDDYLSDLGAETELRDVRPGRPNLIARFPSDRPGKPRLLLAPHTDTVSIAGMTIDPFGGEIRDGKLWGRGATDTKGPMAAMLRALALRANRLRDMPCEIWFAGLMGEEAGLCGSRALAEQEKFDFVIAGEPTGLRPVFAHKGSTRWVIEARGKAVHSSTPERGENAIDLAVEAIAWIRQRFNELTEPHPVLGPSTLSLGILRGGSKINIVPHHCRAEIDMRTVPDFPAERLAEEFRSRWPGIALEVEAAPPLDTDPGHPVLKVIAELGLAPHHAPWFCDAAAFAAKGTPAIALGPGSIEQAHTADEWIAVRDLEEGEAFFTRLLDNLPENLPSESAP